MTSLNADPNTSAAGDEEPLATASELLLRLDDSDPDRRKHAEHLLDALAEREVSAMADAVVLFARDRRRKVIAWAALAGISVVTTAVFWLCGAIGLISTWVGSVSLVVASLVISHGAHRLRRSVPEHLADSVSRYSEAKMCTALLDLLAIAGPRATLAIRGGLRAGLTRLQPTDAPLFTAPLQRRLFGLLEDSFDRGSDLDMCLAALNAIEQVGTTAAVPVVERILARARIENSDPAVQQAAQRCLSALYRRSRHRADYATLGRPVGGGGPFDSTSSVGQGTTDSGDTDVAKP